MKILNFSEFIFEKKQQDDANWTVEKIGQDQWAIYKDGQSYDEDNCSAEEAYQKIEQLKMVLKFEQFINEAIKGTITAILIDAKKREITEVEVSSKDTFKDCYKLMGVSMIEHAQYYGKDILLVDEEGLINGTEHGFKFDGIQYAGSGMLIGNKGQNYGDVKTSIDKVKTLVKF